MFPREAIEQKIVESKKKESGKQVNNNNNNAASDPQVSISNASQSDVP